MTSKLGIAARIMLPWCRLARKEGVATYPDEPWLWPVLVCLSYSLVSLGLLTILFVFKIKKLQETVSFSLL